MTLAELRALHEKATAAKSLIRGWLECPLGHDVLVPFHSQAEVDLWCEAQRSLPALLRVAEAAKDVMFILKAHGPSVVPHLLDTDDNAGERLRQALSELARA